MENKSFLVRMAQKIPRSFMGRGIFMTIRFMMLYSMDRLFDLKYNTETALQATLDELGVKNPNKISGENSQLMQVFDYHQEDFMVHGFSHNAKAVRALRKKILPG